MAAVFKLTHEAAIVAKLDDNGMFDHASENSKPRQNDGLLSLSRSAWP
jgi:hypothetical protein